MVCGGPRGNDDGKFATSAAQLMQVTGTAKAATLHCGAMPSAWWSAASRQSARSLCRVIVVWTSTTLLKVPHLLLCACLELPFCNRLCTPCAFVLPSLISSSLILCRSGISWQSLQHLHVSVRKVCAFSIAACLHPDPSSCQVPPCLARAAAVHALSHQSRNSPSAGSCVSPPRKMFVFL